MTLFKQLFLGILFAFLVVLGMTETIYIRNAHKYLQEQLASHAQDAATSLGMELSTAMAENDLVHAEVAVKAIFDRGYYQSIRILNIRGETVLLKTLPAAPADVPEWFVNALPMETPSAESLVSKGWRQLGRIVVYSHPNFAYKQLWQTLLEATIGLALLFLLAMAALYSFLARMLKPLQAIENVAHAISERNFQLIQPVPHARELRNVVNAINSMSSKLRGIVEHEVSQALRFRDEFTKDLLTGIENRRGFEAYVDALLEDGMNLNSGVMFILQITDFQDLSERLGYEKTDALLKDISSALQSVWQERDLLRARINGETFALVAANISREEAGQLGNELAEAVGAVVDALRREATVNIGCGAVFFSGQTITRQALLAQCDVGMIQSFSNGNHQCVIQSLAADDQNRGSQQWRNLISDAISAQRITLFSQPVIDIRRREEFQVEIVGWLKDEKGELIPANQFIPKANRLRLTPAFDLAVLKKLFGRMASGMIGDDEVAINISIYSIHDPELMDWLINAMHADRLLSQRLVFEFTELGLVQDIAGVEKFVSEMRKLGAKFAVDNFGLHHSAFEYLQRLKPRYVKLSPAYIHDLQINQKHQFFISSVVKITRPLEIRVIAIGIEDIGLLELLGNLGVDGYQGYVTGSLTALG